MPPREVLLLRPPSVPAREWGNLTDKFLTHGYELRDGERGGFKGSGMATAYLSGRVACLREALHDRSADEVIQAIRHMALTPSPQIGYA